MAVGLEQKRDGDRRFRQRGLETQSGVRSGAGHVSGAGGLQHRDQRAGDGTGDGVRVADVEHRCSLIRHIVPKQVRIVTFILVIATFVTIVDYVIQAISLELHKALGAFISLIVVNCLILGRAEAFASQNRRRRSVLDALGMGWDSPWHCSVWAESASCSATAACLACGFLGEQFQEWTVMMLPPGGFFTLAAWLLLFNWLAQRRAANETSNGVDSMNEESLWSIFINACLVNNFVLAYFLGICPFLGVSGKLETAVRMGGAVTFVMLVSSMAAYGIQAVLVMVDAPYLKLISFIAVIASTVQLVEMFIKKVSPALFRALGHFPAADHNQLRDPGGGLVSDQQGIWFRASRSSTPSAPEWGSRWPWC